jgi:putative acetyltransferase
MQECDVIEIARQHPPLLELLAAADREFIARYPELRGRRRGPLLPGIRFFLAHRGIAAVGCCALQQGLTTSVGRSYEVKRLFVIPEARGTGIVDALLISIEIIAITNGAQWLFFETGVRQPEAIHAVLRHGYCPINAYPPYHDDPFAQCFAKQLEMSTGS